MTAKKVLPALGLLCCSAPLLAVGGEGPWLPVLENQAAWERLPGLTAGDRSAPLPVWARVMARSLPATTAAMLEMDHVQRVENPLDPQLRAKIRWVAARANGSRYAEACAAADLVRAEGRVEDLSQIASSLERLPARERRLFTFARKMCEAAYEVTDAEVAELLADDGPAHLSAVVLTLAYANFQDRLFQSLGLEPEEGSPAPLNVRFDWDSLREHPLTVPRRALPEPPADAARVPDRVADEDWRAAPFEELRKRLTDQKLRAPRIPIPPDDVVERQTTPGMYPPGRAAAIKWNGATYGYQPKLTHAWFFNMRRFREEAGLPDEFRQSVFWVVTRSNMCFY